MRKITILASAALLAATATCSLAATTADDAAKVKAALQAYIGSGADAVTITPDGDSFKVSLDMTGLFSTASKGKSDMTVSPFDFKLAPAGTGKWKVTRDGAYELTAKAKDFELNEKFGKLTLDGEYDEALAAFTKLDGTATDITFSETMSDEKAGQISASGKIASVDLKSTAAANTAGGVDVKFTETFGAAELTQDLGSKADAKPDAKPEDKADTKTGATRDSQAKSDDNSDDNADDNSDAESSSGKVKLGERKPEPDAPPAAPGSSFHIHAKSTGGEASGTMTGLKSAALLGVMKFIAAHPGDKVAAADQDVLKPLLRDVLPGFANGTGTGTFNNIEAETPMGVFKLAKVSIGGNFNGAVKDGKLEETISLTGLELPAGLVPSWAQSLVTKDFGLGVSVSGYDLETFLKAEIDAADFTKDVPIPKEIEDKNAQLLLPKGTVDVAITQSVLSNDTYTLKATGTMQAGPAALPTGKAHISLKGIDDVMKAIQAAPPEAGLAQYTPVIVVAKGMGKAEDGGLAWDIEASPDGKIMVNGLDVSKMK